ncbi:MAG: hypothetical protein L0226_08295 [Acidobacteria bacterium]|nr:hypothetical protein [Acidobacteriota bacterium]
METPEAKSTGSTEKTQRRDIDELISVYADPVIKRVMLQRLNLYFDSQRKGLNQPEAEDLYQTVILKLVSYFGDNRNALLTQDICEMSSYVAAVTHNVCNDFLRMKYPEWTRLKNSLRELIRRRPDLSCWTIENHTLCGFSCWAGQAENNEAVGHMVELVQKDSNVGETENLTDLIKLPLSRQVTELFHRVEGPLEIDHLVQIVARLRGIKDCLSESLDDEDLSGLQIVESPSRYYENLEVKELLLKIWMAACELPLNQRKAFIYTSVDYRGDSLVHRVLREQVITITQVYKSLNITRDKLISIWDDLPMNTSAAAAELGTSTRMVAKWRHRALRKLSPLFIVGQ